jgi:malonyl-CoA decarboxylase
MPQKYFLSDFIARITQTGWGRRNGTPEFSNIIDALAHLIGDASEASGLATAMQVLDRFQTQSDAEKRTFFQEFAVRFGADEGELTQAIEAYQAGDADAARRIHYASEPASLEIIRRLNRVPGATAQLVNMRADLLSQQKAHPELKGLDADFKHLFASWFNRGFLELRRIDWHTPADILEKIITYEAVHEINGWDDLRQRVADPDRRLFAFFHPAMPADPLIFVEVALTTNIPSKINTIIRADRERLDPNKANTAVFYSISNCQKGLRGISFGNFLIKQVVAELKSEFSSLETFVTLSPVPGLRNWVRNTPDMITDTLRSYVQGETPPQPTIARKLAALYLIKGQNPKGTAADPVAHFHLGNGASLHAIHAEADLSENGQNNSWGVMVNYLYDTASVEQNHQTYANDHKINAAPDLLRLLD